MVFIKHFPCSQGKPVVRVEVDRLLKYAHFCTMSADFTAMLVAKVSLKSLQVARASKYHFGQRPCIFQHILEGILQVARYLSIT